METGSHTRLPARQIDLNADLAEGVGDDIAMLRVVSSANLCCGAHAGGPKVLRATLQAAVDCGTVVGAHPGYDDPANFGRVVVPMAPAAIAAMVAQQVTWVLKAAVETGARVAYVKPHGALYNLAAADMTVAQAVAEGVARVDDRLVLLGLAGSAMLQAGRNAGLVVAAEAFADRAYDAMGALIPRGQPGAVLHDPQMVAERAVAMVRDARVLAMDGTPVALAFDSLCLHGDTQGAVSLAQAVRSALLAEGIAISPFVRPLP